MILIRRSTEPTHRLGCVEPWFGIAAEFQAQYILRLRISPFGGVPHTLEARLLVPTEQPPVQELAHALPPLTSLVAIQVKTGLFAQTDHVDRPPPISWDGSKSHQPSCEKLLRYEIA